MPGWLVNLEDLKADFFEAMTQAPPSFESFVCRYDGRQRVPQADFKPFSMPRDPQEAGALSFTLDRREVQQVEARKRALVSLREWPRCNYTDTDTQLFWVQGQALLICRKCYQ